MKRERRVVQWFSLLPWWSTTQSDSLFHFLASITTLHTSLSWPPYQTVLPGEVSRVLGSLIPGPLHTSFTCFADCLPHSEAWSFLIRLKEKCFPKCYFCGERDTQFMVMELQESLTGIFSYTDQIFKMSQHKDVGKTIRTSRLVLSKLEYWEKSCSARIKLGSASPHLPISIPILFLPSLPTWLSASA